MARSSSSDHFSSTPDDRAVKTPDEAEGDEGQDQHR